MPGDGSSPANHRAADAQAGEFFVGLDFAGDTACAAEKLVPDAYEPGIAGNGDFSAVGTGAANERAADCEAVEFAADADAPGVRALPALEVAANLDEAGVAADVYRARFGICAAENR